LVKNLTDKKPVVYIITGKIGSGKTRYLSRLIERLREHNLSVAGFLAVRSGTGDSEQSYDIQFLDTGESIPLESRKFVKNRIKIGNFYFNPEAILIGNKILNDPHIFNKDLIIIDEVGIFELEGKVWSDSISYLVSKHVRTMIWVVRDTLIEKVIRRWDLKDAVIIDIEKETFRQAEERILARF